MGPLREMVDLLNRHAEVTARAYYAYLRAKIQKEHDISILVESMQGKSQAEKVSLAHGTNKWLEINDAFNKADARFDLERRKYEVLKFEFQARYLEIKLDGVEIARAGHTEHT